jgi:hypothetical protein
MGNVRAVMAVARRRSGGAGSMPRCSNNDRQWRRTAIALSCRPSWYSARANEATAFSSSGCAATIGSNIVSSSSARPARNADSTRTACPRARVPASWAAGCTSRGISIPLNGSPLHSCSTSSKPVVARSWRPLAA